jgi:GTP cyclohydrolase IIa
MDLQTMQSRLFADLAQYVGNREGYVFFSRFDNMVAVTNGMDRQDHEVLQESVGNRYPITMSLGIGVNQVPVEALEEGTGLIQEVGSAQDAERREVLSGDPLDSTQPGDLQIAHFDVDDVTGKYTDRLNEFDTFIAVEQGYASTMRYMREEHGALSFFVGGDNIIAVCPDLTEEQYQGAIDHVEQEVGVELKVGVGTAESAHDAGFAAKHALEDCRYEGTTVEFAETLAHADD